MDAFQVKTIGQVDQPDGQLRIRCSLAVLALSIAVPVPAAEAAQPAPQAQNRDTDLDEVLVEGRRARERRPGFKDYEESFEWLARNPMWSSPHWALLVY